MQTLTKRQQILKKQIHWDVIDAAEDGKNFDPETLCIIETLARAVSLDDSGDIIKSLTATQSLCPDDLRRLVKKAQAIARMLANSPALRKRLEDQCLDANLCLQDPLELNL
ncbi:hypothetical protein BDR26DRAFT_931603 [Obelidium mucronatum]|nr:hypothetical protein BDR26DRAFT_931603 [Obelidium mucronatum]